MALRNESTEDGIIEHFSNKVLSQTSRVCGVGAAEAYESLEDDLLKVRRVRVRGA